MDSTNGQARSGLALRTGAHTPIVVRPASLEVLIGGPYTDASGKEHTYGHVALRVTTDSTERIYDFGRYAGEQGPTGEGRLRVWSDFSRYIASQNSYRRVTTGFHYPVSYSQAQTVYLHFDALLNGRRPVKSSSSYLAEYRLHDDYHALNNNCVTTSMAGARLALPVLEHETAKHNQGRGMSGLERAAARVSGWPAQLFMPEDLRSMLLANKLQPPEKIATYGNWQ
jgi:hypothetical protein